MTAKITTIKTYGIQRAPSPLVLWSRLGVAYAGALAGIILVPLNADLALLLVASYIVRMWGVEAGYHRYFSHRAYTAGRFTQFLLALTGAISGLRGPLWWTQVHHVHHRETDKHDDPHSPISHSFWYAQHGWFMDRRFLDTDLDKVREFARFPELRWLNRHYSVAYFGLAALLFLAGSLGWLGPNISGLGAMCWGGFVANVLLINVFSLVNSVGHLPNIPGGYRRFATDDASLNRPLLALLTLGTGWHNNHHRYPGAARAGFAWYEVDFVYYSLRALAWLGIIGHLRKVPSSVLAEGNLKPPGTSEEEVEDLSDGTEEAHSHERSRLQSGSR
ncbi:MAG: fatty acid desaturase [Gammaproteobacteria bacterium]|nr:fatty acid desaturase [Gammaproteobacteria bacterium]